MDIKNRLKGLPAACGVYIMKDADDRILYIGKAGNIRKRVSSYFHRKLAHSARTDLLISKVRDIGHVPTTCEAEALILESSLIKKHMPKYNVALKDDKSYPYLKLTLNEEYPRIFITRRVKDDGSRYFGPYTNTRLLRQAIYMIKRVFQLRTCNRLPKNVCLDYYLKQCLGPCAEEVTGARYDQVVKDLVLFLEGKKDVLLKGLTGRMSQLARERKFEEAAVVRDRIEALSAVARGRVRYKFKEILEELMHTLRLRKPPLRIEAFDVSNLYGVEAVGSMIAFYDMKFDKAAYRKFRIKTVEGIDDYKMMQEIVCRRYKRVVQEGLPLPDLVIIDGGKGHLSVAKRQLDNLGLSDVPVIGIAKEFEHIYVPEERDPIRLPRNSGILHLIQRIRDEAHRFAIYYHRQLRDKKSSYSALDEIRGVGEKRKKDLIKHFHTIESIKRARLDELLEVDGMQRRVAKEIIRCFKRSAG